MAPAPSASGDDSAPAIERKYVRTGRVWRFPPPPRADSPPKSAAASRPPSPPKLVPEPVRGLPRVVAPRDEQDGCLTELFEYVWCKRLDNGCCCPQVLLPDTVVYKYRQPSHWYFMDRYGVIRKKKTGSVSPPAIFGAMRRGVDGRVRTNGAVCAVYIYVVVDEKGRRKTCVEHLTEPQLRHFIFVQDKPNDGILQRFVTPKGDSNTAVTCTWSPQMLLVEKKINTSKLTRAYPPTANTYDRTVTFEAEAFSSLSEPVKGERVPTLVERSCRAIVHHAQAVSSGQVLIRRMALTFKLDHDDKLWLLFCNGLRFSTSEDEAARMVAAAAADARAAAAIEGPKRGPPTQTLGPPRLPRTAALLQPSSSPSSSPDPLSPQLEASSPSLPPSPSVPKAGGGRSSPPLLTSQPPSRPSTAGGGQSPASFPTAEALAPPQRQRGLPASGSVGSLLKRPQSASGLLKPRGVRGVAGGPLQRPQSSSALLRKPPSANALLGGRTPLDLGHRFSPAPNVNVSLHVANLNRPVRVDETSTCPSCGGKQVDGTLTPLPYSVLIATHGKSGSRGSSASRLSAASLASSGGLSGSGSRLSAGRLPATSSLAASCSVPPLISAAHPQLAAAQFEELVRMRDPGFLSRCVHVCRDCCLKAIETGAPALHGGPRTARSQRLVKGGASRPKLTAPPSPILARPASVSGRRGSSVTGSPALLFPAAGAPSAAAGSPKRPSSPSDRERAARELFYLIGDGSAEGSRGQLTRPDLRSAVAELALQLSEAKILELYEAIEGRKSGRAGGIDLEELLTLLQARRPELRTFDAGRIAGVEGGAGEAN